MEMESKEMERRVCYLEAEIECRDLRIKKL